MVTAEMQTLCTLGRLCIASDNLSQLLLLLHMQVITHLNTTTLLLMSTGQYIDHVVKTAVATMTFF